MNNETKNQLETINQQIKELSSIYRGVASSYGISDNEFWVWYALLTYQGECSQQDICDMWSLPKQTVNSIVSNLAKKGYLSLETTDGMKKRKLIRLSDEGKQYGARIVNHIFDAEQCAFEKLSAKERETCIELFQKYIHLLKEAVYEKDCSVTE